MQFTNFDLSDKILNSLKRIGFSEPTLIQEKCIPTALEGKDIIGQSQTGSGKTAAFGLPIIQRIKPKRRPQALILTPTRELCEQVSQALQSYAHYSGIAARPIYGGVSYNPQIQALKSAEIIVATPGRLLDHIRQGNTNFKTIEYLILDEADKMFEMGFIDDIRKIIAYIPQKRQTFLFSATFPPEVEELSRKYLNHPVKYETEPTVDPRLLKQTYYKVGKEGKFGLLLHLLKDKEDITAIIFCATRRETDALHENLRKYDIRSSPIHGGHSQARRQKSIDELHDGKIKILVATDVAARGLDIRNVNYIFNWDIPPTRDDYTHRIGRTARAGDSGHAISFVSMQDSEDFKNNILGYGYFNVRHEKNPNFKKTQFVRKGNNHNYTRKNKSKNRSSNRSAYKKKPSRGRHSFY